MYKSSGWAGCCLDRGSMKVKVGLSKTTDAMNSSGQNEWKEKTTFVKSWKTAARRCTRCWTWEVALLAIQRVDHSLDSLPRLVKQIFLPIDVNNGPLRCGKWVKKSTLTDHCWKVSRVTINQIEDPKVVETLSTSATSVESSEWPQIMQGTPEISFATSDLVALLTVHLRFRSEHHCC